MMRALPYSLTFALIAAAPLAAGATQPKIDADTCTQLRLEQIKFRQSGILDDIQKGADWAKANLPAERLHEIERYMTLDEQVKFGCRDAKLSPEAEKASEAAERIEINSDADPTAPPVVQQPGDGSAKPAANAKPAKKPGQKKTTRKKASPPANSQAAADPKGAADAAVDSTAAAASVAPPQSAPAAGAATTAVAPAEPAFGFGETVVMPPPAQ